LLELDYTNVLEPAVHTHGIPKIAFDKAAESSKHIVDDVQRAHSEGKLGFGNLPGMKMPSKPSRTSLDLTRV
jgi:hypothetical protein